MKEIPIVSRSVGIVGSGPAGLSAALWLKNLGLEPWIIDSGGLPGGMLNVNFLGNNWVPGHTDLTGTALAQRFLAHVQSSEIPIRCNTCLGDVSGNLGALVIGLEDKQTGQIENAACSALLLATGTRYRGEEILSSLPGFSLISPDRLFCGPYAFQGLPKCAGLRILIVGGGDNAFENARLLADVGAEVHLVSRSVPRAQQRLCAAVEQAVAAGQCHLYLESSPLSFSQQKNGIEVSLQTETSSVAVAVDRIHVLAGYLPNTQGFSGLPENIYQDTKGYWIVDSMARTNVPGLYAAGDVCNPIFPSVVSAIAQGALAAKTIELDLRTLQ